MSGQVVRTAKRIVDEYTEKALAQAKVLGLDIRKEDLARFVSLIQQDRANWIRNKSKHATVMLVYNGTQRCYAVYSKTHKVITGFLTEEEARFNRGDIVWVREGDKWLQGKIVFVLSRYAGPRKYLQHIQKLRLDTSTLEQGKETLRPQFSYVIAVGNRAIWPPASNLRKERPPDVSE